MLWLINHGAGAVHREAARAAQGGAEDVLAGLVHQVSHGVFKGLVPKRENSSCCVLLSMALAKYTKCGAQRSSRGCTAGCPEFRCSVLTRLVHQVDHGAFMD